MEILPEGRFANRMHQGQLIIVHGIPTAVSTDKIPIISMLRSYKKVPVRDVWTVFKQVRG